MIVWVPDGAETDADIRMAAGDQIWELDLLRITDSSWAEGSGVWAFPIYEDQETGALESSVLLYHLVVEWQFHDFAGCIHPALERAAVRVWNFDRPAWYAHLEACGAWRLVPVV